MDEKATEAAAVTSVSFGATSSIERPEEPIEFTADRPFIFVIKITQAAK